MRRLLIPLRCPWHFSLSWRGPKAFEAKELLFDPNKLVRSCLSQTIFPRWVRDLLKGEKPTLFHERLRIWRLISAAQRSPNP